MNKLLYNQSIIAVNRKTQNTYMIIIQYDTDYYILNHSHAFEKKFSPLWEKFLIALRKSSHCNENFFSKAWEFFLVKERTDAYSNNLLMVAAFYLLCLLDMNGYTLDDMQRCGKWRGIGYDLSVAAIGAAVSD